MNKLSLIFLIMGAPKTGKSYLAMKGLSGDGSDSIMIDLTDDSNAKPAALNVYGEDFEERYFKAKNYQDIEGIVDSTDSKTVCIDESKDFRNVYAKKYLAENKKKKVFPISEWALVYGDIKERIFEKYDEERNFIITSGMKDVRVYKEKEEREVITGQKSPDGLNILPALADIILYVTTGEKGGVRSRKIKVLGNRFLDYAGEEWVAEITGLKDLMDKIVDGGKYKKEWFLV
ncbi:hypothetical protein KAX02_08140 [candidate division WOR-3 bacterium]|nr:hypothetical protein [candidate division WOR-3 bacterium]